MESETTRVEAFSDGVFAIAITLLILDVKVPRHVPDMALGDALLAQWPSYLWSATLCLILNMLLAAFFALPPTIMRRVK